MRIVFVTCPPQVGYDLLKQLVEERLVAGGNIISGVRSIYHWNNEVCDEPEEILIMETAASKVGAMMTRIKALHPYEVPKIVTFEPHESFPDYLRWVKAETKAE